MNDNMPAGTCGGIAGACGGIEPAGAGRWAMLRTLARLAGQGRALELGVGAGLVALPLAGLGVAVHGIDGCARCLARLRARPGGAALPVTLGDVAEIGVGGRFALVYAVSDSFFGLASREAQQRCFARVAGNLAAGGAFLIEAFVPDPAVGAARTVRVAQGGRVAVEFSRYHPEWQYLHAQQVVIGGARARLYRRRLRYAWPSELDRMASRAGLRLRDRRGDWQGARFTERSERHVSIYERQR